jgi:LPXTG-motif cell wall-anchored protein
VKDVRTDFEVYVKDYDSTTNKFTLEILNTGKGNVEALTVEVPKQDNIVVKGSPVNIIGSLDSNDFTTTDFEATPDKGNLNITVYYTDENNVRRTIYKTVSFDPDYFLNRKASTGGSNTMFYVVALILIVGVAYLFYRRHKKNQRKKLMR